MRTVLRSVLIVVLLLFVAGSLDMNSIEFFGLLLMAITVTSVMHRRRVIRERVRR